MTDEWADIASTLVCPPPTRARARSRKSPVGSSWPFREWPDHHTLIFVGPELGWSVRASSALEFHAIGQLSGGLNSKAASDGTRKTGAGATAALGLTWNTRVVFTSLDIGYAYSTVFAPDPRSKIEQRGPFARVAFGFSAYH